MSHHKHSVLDTIECSIIGWQERSPPRDLRPPPTPFPSALPPRAAYVAGTMRDRVQAFLAAKGSAGEWVTRERLKVGLQIDRDNRLTEVLSELVKGGLVERSGRRGGCLCYRLPIGEAPPVPQTAAAEAVLRTLGAEWLTTAQVAERCGMSAGRVPRHIADLVRAGVAERRREVSPSRDNTNGGSYEYRATARTLVGRLRGSC
jgi:DNA-binding transcriptional ArsR family regulator